MADAFFGEIRLFAGNFAPMNWAFCNGQLLSIAQNAALFSLLGTQYGGDGKTTFALPNLQGIAPMGQGDGPGLTPRTVGEQTGTSTVTLTTSEMSAHTHLPQAVNTPSSSNSPANSYWAETPAVGRKKEQIAIYGDAPNASMVPNALASAGGNQPHNNMQPFLAINFIICLIGEFPSRG